MTASEQTPSRVLIVCRNVSIGAVIVAILVLPAWWNPFFLVLVALPYAIALLSVLMCLLWALISLGLTRKRGFAAAYPTLFCLGAILVMLLPPLGVSIFANRLIKDEILIDRFYRYQPQLEELRQMVNEDNFGPGSEWKNGVPGRIGVDYAPKDMPADRLAEYPQASFKRWIQPSMGAGYRPTV